MNKIKKLVNHFSPYLENGIYVFNDTYTRLSRIKVDVKQVKDYNHGTGIKRKIDKFIKGILIGKSIKVYSNTKEFQGNTLLIPSNLYGVKVFSDTEVLTLYDDIDNLNDEVSKYEMISKIVNTPAIIKKDCNYMITAKIDSKPYNKEEALYYFMESYIDYFTKNGVKVDTKKYQEKKYKKIYRRFYDKIYVGDTYQAILEHGDMWTGNILYNDKYYVIDYENVDSRYILYDFFKYIYSEAYIVGDYELLKNYFNGKYDSLLEKYLKALSITFKKEDKVKYFMTFLNAFIEDRIRTNNLYIFNKEIGFIKEVLKNINL